MSMPCRKDSTHSGATISIETAALGYRLHDSTSWWLVVMFGSVRAMLQSLPAGRMEELHALELADGGGT